VIEEEARGIAALVACGFIKVLDCVDYA
jgi:hypothetical protein